MFGHRLLRGIIVHLCLWLREIHLLLWHWLRLVLWLVEGAQRLLLRYSRHGGKGVAAALWLANLSKWVVRASFHGLETGLLILVCRPRVVTARLWRGFSLLLLLLLLGIWIEAGRLRLKALDLLLLAIGIHVYASGLHVEGGIIWLKARLLVWLETRISLIHEAGGLCLHLVHLILIDRVCEEVDLITLLITLVETSRLWLVLSNGIVVKQRLGIALLQLASASFFLFLTELDGFCKIIVVVASLLAFPLPTIFFFLKFTRLQRQLIFGIVFVVALPSLARTSLRSFGKLRSMLL